MMRSIVLAALLVCSVPNTSRPISAAVIASAIVSRSRISPTSTTSASWRTAARSAGAKPFVCVADLAVREHRVLVLVHELDRVLDRDDVARVSPR